MALIQEGLGFPLEDMPSVKLMFGAKNRDYKYQVGRRCLMFWSHYIITDIDNNYHTKIFFIFGFIAFEAHTISKDKCTHKSLR